VTTREAAMKDCARGKLGTYSLADMENARRSVCSPESPDFLRGGDLVCSLHAHYNRFKFASLLLRSKLNDVT
jgi:hypothetical protein